MYKCKICGKKYTELTALYSHIENKHKDMIPKDMSVQQFYYYMKTGRTNGNCVMCKKPTSWNHNTGKYNRFCGDEKCKEEYVKIMKGRMVAKYGKTHLLNDPNKQREMLANRSISGVYKWSDGKHETTYTGSYELDFLRTLDDFFDWDPEDISMPSPHTYTYKYEGEDKFYIPDVFIHSLDLEIEIKDGGDNPNNHHKIQEVDKEKERLKDEVLCSQKAFHYVKITNKNYENFFRFLKEIKKAFEKFEDETKIPRIFKIEDIKGTNVKPVKESWDIVEEGLIEKLKGKLLKIKDPYNMSYEELKAKVDNAKKLYKQNITDGTIKLSEPNHVHYYTTELENEKRRVDNLIQNIHDEDGKKTWILKHYYEWLDQFEANLIKDMVKMLKDDVRDSKAKLTKSFSNCKDESDYKEFITAVTYMINYYRKLSNLVDIPEVKAHCKWLEMMHGKACDKAGIGDGPLVFESEEYYEEKFEGFQKDAEKLIKKYDKFSNTKYNDADMFLSLQYNLAKNSPKELQKLLSKLIKYAKCDDDFRYVEKLVGDSETHYHYLLDKHPNLKDEYELYYDWIKKGGMEKEIKDRKKDLKKSKKKIQEALDEIDFVEEKFEPDKFLVWFDKPIQKLKGGKINVYHGSSVKMNDTVKPISPNVGATKHSDPRWSTYVWDNREDAIAWASAWAVKDVVGARNLCYVGHNNKGKTMIAKPENMSNKEFMLYLIENVKTFYVYEFEIDINDLEIGSCPTIREYTVSKPMEIIKTFEYKLNKEIFRRCFEIVSLEELQEFERTMFDSKLKMPKHRGMILNNILSTCKDPYRNIIRTEVENGNVQPGDDISFLKYSINRHYKNDSYGFLESYIIDTMEESSISIPQMNYYLQNQYEEEMRRYLNTYKKYYNLMLKEQPSAVKHINEDIKKCLIVIDGMASKGVENNLVQFAKDDLGEIVKAAKHGKPVKVYETFGDYIEERAGKLDRALIWLDKPKEKRKGGNITLYHGSLDFDKFEKADAFAEYGYKSWKKGDVIEPNAIVPGATALSKPRYGIYFWDNKEYAYEWAVNRAIGFIVGRENRTYKLSHGKAVLIRKENGMSDDDAIKNIIKIAKQKGLDNLKIYESEVSIHDLEITGLSTVKEYTVSKPVTITKVENVKLTPELLKKHCDFIEHDKFDDYRKNAFKGDIKIERNHSIPMLLALLYMEPDRDAYRGMLLNKLVSSHEDPKEELRKHGGKYRRMLNKSVKQKSSTLVENMVDDMVNIDDNVNDINCISVQDDNVSISNEIIECKLVYENSNARQLFSLTDTNSKLIINDELVIQRDKVGLHCSIKPLYESFEYENYIEFQVTLNGNEELNITDEKISEGVNISSLFKFNDDEYKFIKEACVKIFGVQPKEIKTK